MKVYIEKTQRAKTCRCLKDNNDKYKKAKDTEKCDIKSI